MYVYLLKWMGTFWEMSNYNVTVLTYSYSSISFDICLISYQTISYSVFSVTMTKQSEIYVRLLFVKGYV